MIKKHFVLVIFCLFCQFVVAANIITTINFDIDNYTFLCDQDGMVRIVNVEDNIYGENNEPGLPFRIESVAIPSGTELSEFTFSTATPKLIRDNVIISPTPSDITTDGKGYYSDDSMIVSHYSGVYPSSSCINSGTLNIGGVCIAQFQLSPFVYDSDKKQLFFIDSISIDIKCDECICEDSNSSVATRMRGVIKSMVTNPEDVDNIISQIPTATHYFNDKIEYLIITNRELEPAFHNLIKWKRVKGVFAGIITIDQIDERYEGINIQEKIKNCLINATLEYGLKYVVLGGDDSVVPTKNAYLSYYEYDEYKTTTPCDKFYACLYGYNNRYEDSQDIFAKNLNVNFTESVYVSRIPVQTLEQANNYVLKLLDYESGRDSKRLEKSLITAGVTIANMFHPTTSRSDVDCLGDILYDKYINPYWNGTRIRFYDTGTDFPGDSAYDVNTVNMQSALASNSLIFSMGTHGSYNNWALENKEVYFSENALSLNNQTVPIIITEACDTNGFDNVIDPCLSEAFIRNPNNSVIAYIGSSRSGWAVKSLNYLGCSKEYEGTFYKYLFGNEFKDKHLGEIFSASKLYWQGQCNRYNPYRWLQLSINLMGDSEMPIYTMTPKEFKDINIHFSDSNIQIDCGTDDCRVSVLSLNDNGETFHDVLENVTNANFSKVPKPAIVSITKQNYIPYVYVIGDSKSGIRSGEIEYYIDEIVYKDEIFVDVAQSCDSTITLMSCKYDNNSRNLLLEFPYDIEGNYNIEIKNIFGKTVYKNSVSSESITVCTDTFQSGIYFVSLKKGMRIVETQKILFK
ncbi:MAG: T9SS type A sorting domain-containing protein [Muribaculaceae bacterium]|nr:T9SS type A sorting domain-containing protein [Muribaculaceae bacterium]